MPPPNYDSRAGGIIAVAVVMIVVSTIAVFLRFWSRAVNATRLRFWWDDYAMLACLVICAPPPRHLHLALADTVNLDIVLRLSLLEYILDHRWTWKAYMDGAID